MGMESYLLRLRGRIGDSEQITSEIQRLFGIIPDLEQYAMSDQYSYFVYRDEAHVIEYEFFLEADVCEISLRFALCHPSSIDDIFQSQAIELMNRFNLTATICEEVPLGEPRNYSAEDSLRFSENCFWSIQQARCSWQKMFGSETVGLSVGDACRKYFLGELV